ncbi:hypothetical protein QSJ18_17065 [Gordonia sp. ABSL1-1]|uniref:hypothetical protein n=1 Tax=Gordonia sp. ABSL1-1 TaxID=3053923 RepID=UPI0025732C77|nr:hypothetical protein [Gordonia sp. ABSL1-1]MDL9938461.1 hypothetical protein [Gordonia sp. ABSL1-1]
MAGLPLAQPLAEILTPPTPVDGKLSKGFAALQKSMRKSLPGRMGMAIVPIGGDRAISLGPLKTGRAWSTLKVPVSLAAQRKGGPDVAALENKAITLSDNDAAGDLWGFLGGGVASVDAVTAVLREGHDPRTRVSSEVDVPKSYPGHTAWALADQARFAAHLPCMDGSEQVIRLMSAVAPNQQWGVAGVGRSSGAISAVKGGWGPATSASVGYLVRQVAIVSTRRGQVAVSLAAVPRSGRFQDGIAMLNRMGRWLGKYYAQLPVGRC